MPFCKCENDLYDFDLIDTEFHNVTFRITALLECALGP